MPANYTVFADSSCDISKEVLNKWGIKVIELKVLINGEKEYGNFDIPAKEFYALMKNGYDVKTSALNGNEFESAFKSELCKGNDVLYLGFSSALSSMYNTARLTAEKLKEEFEDREIITVDTLCASAGYGLLLYLIFEKMKEGKSIGEIADFAENIKNNICHWFTVGDLSYLKKGGRVSPALAFVGNALGFKPIMHMDNEGHLVSVAKVRGIKNSISAIADKYGELAIEKSAGTVFISHGDVKERAEMLAQILKERYKISVKLIADIGPVIGAHSGPETLAVFFLGKTR